MSLSDIITADIRLAILRGLSEDLDYSLNEAILQRMLSALGHGISADRLRSELAWLEEQRLVTTEIESGILVARLTTRGEDVAQGRARVPGVARPGP